MTTVLMTEWYPGVLIEIREHERDGQGDRVVTAVALDNLDQQVWESDARGCAAEALALAREWVGE